MTIADDEAVIGNCLQSIQDIVDCVVICDRGSKDGTRSMVEKFLREQKIIGAIVSENDLFSSATKILRSLGWDLTQTYLLMLRPDALCEVKEGFSKGDLKRDAYLILEPSEDGSYFRYRPNFLRASIPWTAIEPYVNEELRSFSWHIPSNPEYQSQRIQKRMDELLAQVIETPSDVGALLTLAGYYRSLKIYDQAIGYYHQCAVQNGTRDEIWLARYLLSQCLYLQGDEKNALHWRLEAYRLKPERVEVVEGLFMDGLPYREDIHILPGHPI